MHSGVGVLVLRCGHISYIVKINYLYENLLLYSKAQIRQTEGVVMISKEGSTKIVNFAIFLLLFLSTPGHGSDKLSIKQ